MRLHALGYRQIFLPVRFQNGRPVATREYFPRNFRAAARQRSRWVAGIALQGWQNHGWRGQWPQAYWYWRDRKGLIGNLLSPVANLLCLTGLCQPSLLAVPFPPWLWRLCLATFALALIQVALRTWCSARIYRWPFAAAAPLRIGWGNVVNFVATTEALRQFAAARFQRRAMAWRKTEHIYPRPRLGEVLVRLRTVPIGDVEAAVSTLPKGLRLGEYLIQSHKLSEESLYQALSVQSGIPAGPVNRLEVDRLAARALPAEAARRWKVLPFRVAAGQLHVAIADVPSRELTRELASLSSLEISFRLVRPAEFAQLSREYLPSAE